MSARITPVILSGGAGQRLWPLSRALYPKQLLPLVSDYSMLQETVRRLHGHHAVDAPVVVCNDEHRFIIAEQLRGLDVEPEAIVLEPMGRNTAPAAAIAALILAARDPNTLMLVLPADHAIQNRAAFAAAVDKAADAAEAGKLVTFGITPDRPETGYGYIARGAALPGHDGVFAVEAFVEKPDAATAQRYLDGGKHAWNSGMFLFPAQLYLDELERHAPGIVAACRAALEGGQRDLDFLRLDKDSFGQAASTSIDYAVMEKTDKAAVIPVDIGWTDVGAWSALWEIGDKDENGNVLIGDTALIDTKDSYIRSESGILTATVGVEDMVVIATDDVVLVAPKGRVQDVKAVVGQLKQAGRSEATAHRRVYRPWGFYQSVHEGDRFQVKRITVNPGAKLSLQKHFHRAEHWIVVNGTGIVTRDDEVLTLKENESVYIPLGAVHRLENPGKVPLNLIEVQSGSYLGEDDIVRLEDTYGRAGGGAGQKTGQDSGQPA